MVTGKVTGNCIHVNRASFLHQNWPSEQQLCFAHQTTQRRCLLSGDLSGSVQTFQMHHSGAEILPDISQAGHTHAQTQKFSAVKKEGFPMKCSSSLDQNTTALSHCYYSLTTQRPAAHFLVTPHLSPVTTRHVQFVKCHVKGFLKILIQNQQDQLS